MGCYLLLLEVLNQFLGLVVLLLQGLVLALGLLQVFIDSVTQGLRLDPVALKFHHPVLILLNVLLKLILLQFPPHFLILGSL